MSNKIKVSELPVFDAVDYIKTVDDIKGWMQTSIDEDEGLLDLEYTLKLLLKAIDRIKEQP